MEKFYMKISLAVLIFILITFIGYIFYYQKYIFPYTYWYQLIEKDPKPLNVSLKDYQLKNKLGFCWRDQKYYSQSELEQKAMLSFVQDILLVKLNFYKTGEVLDANDEKFGSSYIKKCRENNVSCRLWLVPEKYKIKEIVDFIGINQNIYNEILSNSNKTEINSKENLSKIKLNNTENQSILMSVQVGAANLYPSDCCAIKTYQELLSSTEEKNLATGRGSNNPYEAYIPSDINIQEYGVGNYFLETTMIHHAMEYDKSDTYYTQKRTYTYFLNNCGDVLFKPFYWR